MQLSDTDRAVVLDVIRTYCTGVTEVPMYPAGLDQEEMLYRRMLLIDETFDRATRDRRMSPEGRALLMTCDRLKLWLEAEQLYLQAHGIL